MKFKAVENGFFLKLEIGEEIVQNIVDFVRSNNIQSGAISGIGALENVSLGYFNRDKKEYQERTHDGIYELLNITGNIAWFGGNPIAHVHCLLSDADYKVIGGHLFSGTVAVTAEIYVQTFSDKFNRAKDSQLELYLLEF